MCCVGDDFVFKAMEVCLHTQSENIAKQQTSIPVRQINFLQLALTYYENVPSYREALKVLAEYSVIKFWLIDDSHLS